MKARTPATVSLWPDRTVKVLDGEGRPMRELQGYAFQVRDAILAATHPGTRFVFMARGHGAQPMSRADFEKMTGEEPDTGGD